MIKLLKSIKYFIYISATKIKLIQKPKFKEKN